MNIVAAAVTALRAKGATVESQISDSGYLSSISYGTPWRAADGTPWGGFIHGPDAEVVRGSFVKHRVAGITWADVEEVFGVSTGFHRMPGTTGVTLYENERLIEARGERGDGLCVAVGFHPMYGTYGPDDHRNHLHIYIDADGQPKVGQFG